MSGGTDWIDALRERLGGSWDGHDAQCHGLVRFAGEDLKIEVILGADAPDRYTCTIFVGGHAAARAIEDTGPRAVGAALKEYRASKS